jgi:EmrB/QacA subfamily drug resistance transporter
MEAAMRQAKPTTPSKRTMWTFAVASAAAFMAALDNLVVTMALPSIQRDLGAGLEELEWTVNAYTLTFAVLLLTGAALGERFGRRRLFVLGLATFTAGSAAAALAPSLDALLVARAVQGVGGAIVTPLSLTLLTAAVPEARRGLAIGAWSGISGLGVGLGPVVGGAVVEGISWHWIFWLNVPIGALTILLALRTLNESRGTATRLDIPGLTLAGLGLLGIVYGLVRGNQAGWSSAEVLASLAAGAILIGCFVRWELRASTPMLPMRFFHSRTFAATNAVSFLMYLGLFGSAFLLAQYLQTGHGYSPLEAGIRTLPWTAVPLFIAPIAGILSDRIGGRPLMIAGLALQATALAWIATIASPTVPYGELAAGFFVAGVGMSFVLAPVANTVLSAVGPHETGQASGANNAIRELGGVFGVAILAAIFNNTGSYASPDAFVHGLGPAILAGACAMGLAGLVALLVPAARRRRAPAAGAEPRRVRPATAQA